MQNEQTTLDRTFTGLLECPLHKGFIEFEYAPGDLVAELRQRISDVWGPPVSGLARPSGRHPDLLRSWWQRRQNAEEDEVSMFFDADIWTILCQDDSGAFLTLHDQDEIPTSPPASTGKVAKANFADSWPAKLVQRGLILGRSSEDRFRLRLSLNRDYVVPKDKTFSINLLALVAVTGG